MVTRDVRENAVGAVQEHQCLRQRKRHTESLVNYTRESEISIIAKSQYLAPIALNSTLLEQRFTVLLLKVVQLFMADKRLTHLRVGYTAICRA